MKNDLTIVVIAVIGGAALRHVVSSVRRLGLPLLVVEQDGRCLNGDGTLRTETGQRSVPGRREAAAHLVDTPFVAFLEDSCLPEPGWADHIVTALAQPDVAAVGGPILIAPTLHGRYRALALTEFGQFHPANAAGADPHTALPGANFAFRTTSLVEALDSLRDGLVDNEVFAWLCARGLGLAYDPAMAVTYVQPHREGASLLTRFRHGRIYGSKTHVAGARWTGAAKALALPAVLFARTWRQARRSRQATAGAMAWVAAMHLFWSAGEFAGAVRGASAEGVGHWT